MNVVQTMRGRVWDADFVGMRSRGGREETKGKELRRGSIRGRKLDVGLHLLLPKGWSGLGLVSGGKKRGRKGRETG